MIVIIGLVLLTAAVVVGLTAVLSNYGSGQGSAPRKNAGSGR